MAFFASPVRRSTASIVSLADQVAKVSTKINAYLTDKNHAQPDFSSSSPSVPETYDYQSLRNQLNDAAHDLLRLANGPKNTFRTMTFSHTDLAAVQVALRRKFFHSVPDDNVGLSASEVAKAAGMDEDRATRILKMLATHRIFAEEDGKFRHTAASAFLKTSVFASMAEAALDDFFKAASDMDKWIEDSPYEMSSDNSAFTKRFGKSFYGNVEADKYKSKRFSEAMTSWSLIDDNLPVLRDYFDWKSLANKKVVDVGGGNGHVSLDLARNFPDLKFIVQDWSSRQLSSAQSTEVGDRVTFQQYDFYNPQQIHDAGVYLCRATFHNHNDEESIIMLRALIPALEGRDDNPVILINDVIVPERAEDAVTRAEENQHRQLDLCMMALFGAKERTKKHWQDLFNKVDARLEIVGMHYNPRGAGILQARLRST